jgi:hypothetical protein
MSQHQQGDKVRVRKGPFLGKRGTLKRKESTGWIVSFEDGDSDRAIRMEDMTNFSLAARKAWNRMPNRKVGRPAGTKVSNRLSVIFRVDRALWEEFVSAEQAGLVNDRTKFINDCLRKLLSSAKRRRPDLA